MVKLKEDLLDLEDRLINELRHLKAIMLNEVPSNYQSSYDRNRNYFREVPQTPPRPVVDRNFHEFSSPKIAHVTQKPEVITTQGSTTTTTSTIAPIVVPQVQLKSLESPRNRIKMTTTEATTTTTTLSPKNEYSFYWKLVNFPKVFMHAKKNEIFSDSFKIKGLTLRIRAHLNFEEKEELTLDTEQLANVDDSEKMEISIGDGLDGLVFKEIVDEKLFQFSFEIIDQVNHPNNGFISPLYWNTENEGFLIENSIQMLSSYLKNDSLLIKVTISF